ncbi:unnamed protein product [Phytophthora lilii]|uniref:Unnamed protein product n=1 Tax=Phytophthora lilii TaxID=2077276 RepID=A0A9W6TXF2_9STRA|nr:unnamed protein product [Phytophthora lilii]
MASSELQMLTTEVVMNRAGVYDPMTLKELILRDEGLAKVDEICAQSLSSLEILSLSHNRLSSLERFQYFVNLTELRSLDLGGNPCSRDVEGYKFRVVRALSRLKTLDGDHITQLDKDLTEEFFATVQKRSQQINNGFIGARPYTAPASAGARGSLTATMPPGAIKPDGVDPFASSLMPRGNVRLFRDDFLNNNPILLEYMANNAGGTASLEERESSRTITSGSGGDDTDEISIPTTSNFVDKMRSANPLSSNEVETTEDDIDASSSLKKLSLSPSVSTSHLGIDPSDPNTTIRKLLKHIEILMVRIFFGL